MAAEPQGTHTDAGSGEAALKRTPLFDLHEALGARMTPFAGYAMPLQYKAGVLEEHRHVRAAAGLFDVSHMGQIAVRPRLGALADATTALESVAPVDLLRLAPGRQRYALLTTEDGGVIDDLMIAHRGDHLLLVVNAARRAVDEAHLAATIGDRAFVEPLGDRALIALQGPGAEAALAALAPSVVGMRFMDVAAVDLVGTEAVVSRSGYTGEDGFEIGLPADRGAIVADALLALEGVAPIGLAARDTLRLEAGLCLYGAELDEATSPIEAALDWAIAPARRTGGPREGGFPGAARILGEMASGAARRRVGLRPDGRAPVRAGAPLFESAEAAEPIGVVTSGGFGPSVEAPIAMGRVATRVFAPGARVFAEVRGKRLSATIAPLPFIKQTYKR